MRAVDLTLAEKLREVLDFKIRKCRKEIFVYMPIEVERIQAQIMAHQWVQSRIQDMMIVIENESKDTKIRI
jgi:hypothetical protein